MDGLWNPVCTIMGCEGVQKRILCKSTCLWLKVTFSKPTWDILRRWFVFVYGRRVRARIKLACANACVCKHLSSMHSSQLAAPIDNRAIFKVRSVWNQQAISGKIWLLARTQKPYLWDMRVSNCSNERIRSDESETSVHCGNLTNWGKDDWSTLNLSLKMQSTWQARTNQQYSAICPQTKRRRRDGAILCLLAEKGLN